jgi:hypothetical protein
VKLVSDDDRHFDPVQTLTDHAKHLNAINAPSWCPKISYEIMSGALIWSDETNKETPLAVIYALRFIVAYRTSLMLNKPREELKPMWELELSLFPKWVGFRPERRQATPTLLHIYRRGEVSLRKCLRDMEREMDKGDVEPGAPADGGRALILERSLSLSAAAAAEQGYRIRAKVIRHPKGWRIQANFVDPSTGHIYRNPPALPQKVAAARLRDRDVEGRHPRCDGVGQF